MKALFHPYNGLVQNNGLGTPPYQIDLFCASSSVIILSAIPNGVHLSFRLGNRPFLHQKQLRSHYTTDRPYTIMDWTSTRLLRHLKASIVGQSESDIHQEIVQVVPIQPLAQQRTGKILKVMRTRPGLPPYTLMDWSNI